MVRRLEDRLADVRDDIQQLGRRMDERSTRGSTTFDMRR
jgi:hypothetical protein